MPTMLGVWPRMRLECLCGTALDWRDHLADRQSGANFQFAFCIPCLRLFVSRETFPGYERWLEAYHSQTQEG